MSFGKDLRALYEAHMKQIRDRNARDEYVYDEGVTAGETRGLAIGKADSIIRVLSELGTVECKLEQRINSEKNLDILDSWLIAAVRAKSVDEFCESTKIFARIE